MKKTKFSSVLLLSAACLLASCGNRAITPTSTSSPTEPASTSIVTPSTPATTSQDPIPSEQSQESEQSIPSEQSQESAEPTSSEQTPDISSGPAQDSSGDTPVSHVFAGTKNGVALDLVDLKEEGWTCWAYYSLDLAKDDKIVLTVDGTPVPFKSNDGELGAEFVAPRDGTYKFYINSATECWVDVPAAPTPAAKALKVEVNGAEASVTPEENPGNDVAVYKVTLAVGDKLVVKGDGAALPLGDSDSTEFTCKVAGEHTVYVNKEYKVYVTEPAAQ